MWVANAALQKWLVVNNGTSDVRIALINASVPISLFDGNSILLLIGTNIFDNTPDVYSGLSFCQSNTASSSMVDLVLEYYK